MIEGGIYTPDTPIDEAIEEYVKDAAGMSKSTKKKRKRIPRDFVENIGRKYDVETVGDIHPDHIQKYIEHRRKDNVSDLTIRKEITHIQGLCSFYNYYELNQFLDIDKDFNLDTRTNIQKSTEDIPAISEDEYLQMVENTNSLRDECIYRVLWETGIRRIECECIDLSDIDLDEQEITINTAKKDGTRPVFIDFSTRNRLERYIEVDRQQYPNKTDTDALFLSHDGMRLTGEHLIHIVADKAEDLGIQSTIGTNSKGHKMRRITAHGFRHAFAIQRLNNGIQLKLLADLMGNSVDTVAETYLQTNKEQRKRANREHRPKPYGR